MKTRIHTLHRSRRPQRARRAFTMLEIMIAAVITAFVLGSLSLSLSQLSRAKDSSKMRLDAHLRADAALESIRRDLTSVVRHEDLYWTRLLLRDATVNSPIGPLDRDDAATFTTRLQAVNDLDFNGEGIQYESQFRVMEDDDGAVLWQRLDPVPDEYPLAGGIASPMVDGIIALRFEAYDGYEWFRYWDSDEHGLPKAVRVTVTASGSRNGERLFDAPLATVRTIVPLDRVAVPIDHLIPEEDEEEEELEDVTDYTVEGDGAGPGGAQPNQSSPSPGADDPSGQPSQPGETQPGATPGRGSGPRGPRGGGGRGRGSGGGGGRP